MKGSELLRLEQFVEKLLQKFSSLKVERDHLLQSVEEKQKAIADHKLTIKEKDVAIAARDEKIAELKAQLSVKDDERDEISNKVNSIMEQIELWELALEEDEVEGNAGSVEADAQAEENKALSTSLEEEEKPSKEERIQCDLF